MVKTAQEVFRGELERLFSSAKLRDLCSDYLGIDPEREGLYDETKAVFVHRLVDWCERSQSLEALADTVLTLKKGMVDPRVRHILDFQKNAEQLSEGTIVSGFIVGEQIKVGGLGTVYKCARSDSSVDGEPVFDHGLKVIHSEHAVDRHASKRFMTLMRFLKTRKPTNILPVELVGELGDGRPYVIYPWMEGKSLSELKPLPPLKAVEMLQAIVNALSHVHEMEFVHGDLNPGNVLVLDDVGTGEGPKEIALLGFGVDRLFFRSGPQANGSRFYGHFNGMTPEQARGKHPDIRSDIYGLGSLLFELIHGEPPFSGKSPIDVVAAHLTAKVPSLVELHDDTHLEPIDKLVESMMAKAPRHRPQTLGEVRQSLDETKSMLEAMAIRSSQMGTREDIEESANLLLDSPTDEEALRKLVEQATAHNSWIPAMEVLEEAASKTEDESTARKLLLEAARAAVKHIKDYDKAAEIYHTLAQMDPTDHYVKDQQLDLLRSQGKYGKLIEELAARAEASSEIEEQLNLIREIASVYEHKLHDYSKAFDYRLACVDLSTTDDEVISRLERLAELSGRYGDLAAAFADAAKEAETASDFVTATHYYKVIGKYYLDKLREPAYALTCVEKVLEFDPDDVVSLETMAEIYRESGGWDDLLEVLNRLADAESAPTAKRNYLAEAARVRYERQDDMDGALKSLETVYSADPTHQKTVDLLAEIYEKKKEWEKLTNVLSKNLESLSGKGREIAEKRYRLGELFEEMMDDLPAAEEQYEKGLQAEDAHLPSIRGLARIFARKGEMTKLRDNLKLQLSLVETPKQEVLTRERLAVLSEEEFKDYQEAALQFEMVLEIDPHYKDAFVALSRLYRLSEEWEKLTLLLEKRANLEEVDLEEKRDLLKERATVIREKLKDAKRAAEAFSQVAAIGADDAIDALARAQEEAGEFEAAIDTLRRIVDRSEALETKVENLTRIADIQLAELGRAEEAATTLRQVVDMAPKDLHVLGKLKDVYVVQGNYAAAVATLDKKLELVQGVIARADVFAEKGVICLDNLHDEERASEWFEQALQLDEHNLVAGDRLSEIYRIRGEWDKALPIYERWVDSADSLPSEKQIELYTQLGEAYDRLEYPVKALDIFKKAAEIAGDEPHLVRRLGEVALPLEAYGLAREHFGKYLRMKGDELDETSKIELLVKLGRACLGVGEHGEAAKYARQASKMNPTHQGARLLLADVHQERGDYRGLVEVCRAVLESGGIDDAKRISLLRRAALALFENLKDPDGAIGMLKEALDIDANDRAILGDLLKIYTTMKKFDEVIDVILRIAFLVDDPKQVARYYLTAAKIYRRELKRPDKAIEYFELVLEKDPTLVDAETAVVELLKDTQGWEKLESFYKRKIAALPKDAAAEERIKAYAPLQDLLVTKLNRRRDGILITEALTQLEPGNVVWLDKLSELYGWDVEYATKNIALLRKLLELNPGRVDSFRMLYRIYSALENPDRAWCASSLLALLNQASPEERVYFKEYQPNDLPTLSERVHTEQWTKYLLHRDMNPTITAIFANISNAVLQMKTRDFRDFSLNPNDGVDVTQDTSQAAGYINFAAGALEVTPPKLFRTVDEGTGIRLINTRPLAFLTKSGGLNLKDRMGIAFSLGQQLTLLRPGLIIRHLVESGTELSAWLLASIKCFVPTLPIPADLEVLVSERMAPIRALGTETLERLQGNVRTFVAQTTDVDLKRWSRSVDYTMDRAGLILCGDVSVAVRVLKSQLKDQTVLADRLRALTLFVVSDDHFALREHLGVALVSA